MFKFIKKFFNIVDVVDVKEGSKYRLINGKLTEV